MHTQIITSTYYHSQCLHIIFLLIALNKQIVTEKTMHAQTDIQTVKGWGMTGAEQKKRMCQIFQHFTTRGSKNIRNCFIGNVPSLTNFYLS